MESPKKIVDTNNKIKIILKNTTKNYNKIKISKNNLLLNKNNSFKSSFSSNEYDKDKQENISTKKLIEKESVLPKINKNNSQKIISINKKLINDLNHQINTLNKRIFGNDFAYKQTINLQELNDYIIYEKTKKNIANKNNKGLKNTFDFRIPLIYRRIANHFKKEDLIPMKIGPKINLEDILINHNSIFRKSMTQNRCKNYYLKRNVKLLKKNLKENKVNYPKNKY